MTPAAGGSGGGLGPRDHLGPYEIVELLGTSAMSEVYRARDTRLGRDVAVKILPGRFASDAGRMRRFELEARAVAALAHPSIVALYDVGTHDGSPYLVTELLHGRSLYDRLRAGGLPLRKALDLAVQIAQGLAAAHEKGIVHRDLKPANVFITKDGRVKILDFGIAKLTRADLGPFAGDGGAGPATETGTLLGTAGYISPEQVRGLEVDQRADIFSFGCVLYEMVSGKPAFRKDTTAETMTAILHDEPPAPTNIAGDVPPVLQGIVTRCLEKSPEDRFQSARDLAFDLAFVGRVLEPGAEPRTPPERRRAPRRWLAPVAGLGLVVLAFGGGWLAGVGRARPQQVKFTPLTFRRGWVSSARFTSDGRTVVYSASWDGAPTELFSTRLGSPESSALGYTSADLLAVSPSGELALRRNSESPWLWSPSILAIAPFAGGTPRDLDESLYAADYSPDGGAMAVARATKRGTAVEYPVGTPRGDGVLGSASPGGSFYSSLVRVSRDGRRVAYLRSGVDVVVADANGSPRKVASAAAANGLAWSPDGREIWFDDDRRLRAVTLSGRQREIYSLPTRFALHDIAADGRLLVTVFDITVSVLFRDDRDGSERNLAWLDRSLPSDLSPDGRAVAFFESEAGVASVPTVFLRDTSGAPPVKLGPGQFPHFSPDGRFVAAVVPARNEIVVYPVGAGEPRTIRIVGIRVRLARPLSDGRTVCFWGGEPGHGERIWTTDGSGSGPRPIAPEGAQGTQRWLTPDGRYAVTKVRGVTMLYPLAGGEPVTLKGVLEDETIAAFTADGRSVFAYSVKAARKEIYKVDVGTGRREFLRTLDTRDHAGTGLVAATVMMTPDGQRSVYAPDRWLSDLYLVEGLR